MEPEEQEQETLSTKQRVLRYLLFSVALVTFASLSWIVWDNLRQNVWAYYTDDADTKIGVEENKVRYVLWDDPKQNLFGSAGDQLQDSDAADQDNQASERMEAAFSPNGNTMVVVRDDDNGSGTDLFLSQWNGRVWSRPLAMDSLNSEANERGPAFSRDGQHLYFASDREGGQGGYDLYLAHRDGEGWSPAESLGENVNTSEDELGPGLSADGNRLFFSSHRSSQGKDILVADVLPPIAEPEPSQPGEGTLSKIPRFSAPTPVEDLNSEADDLQADLTSRGDHVFLASDRERDETSGFGLYLSRVVNGKELPPEKIDLYFEAGEVTDPAIRMEGFDLVFSRNPDTEAAASTGESPNYLLYRSTTREVHSIIDNSRWKQFMTLLGNVIWWVLLAIAALAALIYILEHWRDITDLYHKCLAGSVAIHLIVLLLMMIWLITKELSDGGDPQSPKIAITIDALAQEQLALESMPDEAKISDTPIALVADQLVSDFKIPRLEAQDHTKTSPIITRTSKTSLVSDVRPSKANLETADEPVTKPDKISPLLSALPETMLPEPETPELDERAPGEPQKAEERANPEADVFRPTEAVPQVETKKSTESAEISNKAAEATTETKQIEPGDAAAETTDTGGDLVVAHSGLEAQGQPPILEGEGNVPALSLNLPGTDPETDPLLPGALQTPKGSLDPAALTNLIRKQRDKPSLEIIEQLGGSDATERAIGRALEWLARNQEPDGRWDIKKHGGNGSYETAGVGFALLCFYGWDVSHVKPGKFQGTVKKALKWLVAQQQPNGDLSSSAAGNGRMYAHGIASIALCEAYGLTKDPALKEPAERAIKLIVAAQDPTKGGWRYSPKPSDSDTSVTGWQYMALHSARMAGIEVKESVFDGARRWLDHAGGGRHGGIYGYTGPQNNNQVMTATGMFCRQLDLVPPTDPRMPESAQALKMRPINVTNPAYYYLYYGTLALYQHQGPVWMAWNERMKETLPNLQKKNGAESGSWDKGAGHAASGGRVVSTTLATLSLEVYYRLLPMYGFRNKDAVVPPLKKKGN